MKERTYTWRWSAFLLLLYFYLLQSGLGLPMLNESNALGLIKSVENNDETVDRPTLEVDVNFTVGSSCRTSVDCKDKYNVRSMRNWFCNITIHQCQLRCPTGYHYENSTCWKSRKSNVPTAIFVEKTREVNLKDSSVGLGSSCASKPNICKLIAAVCIDGKCGCGTTYPIRDETGNQCLKRIFDEREYCHLTAQCVGKTKTCISNMCRATSDIVGQTEAFLLGFGVFVIVLLVFISLLGIVGRRGRRLSRRNRQNRTRSGSTQYTTSTLELMAEFRDPPPAYSEVFMVSRNRVTHKPPSYDEAMQHGDTGWTTPSLQVPIDPAPQPEESGNQSVSSSLVMGENSNASANAEALRSELRRYPRDNQVPIGREFPELVESNV